MYTVSCCRSRHRQHVYMTSNSGELGGRGTPTAGEFGLLDSELKGSRAEDLTGGGGSGG